MKLVGLCFGCQLLAEALGGRVGPNTDGAFVLKGEWWVSMLGRALR